MEVCPLLFRGLQEELNVGFDSRGPTSPVSNVLRF